MSKTTTNPLISALGAALATGIVLAPAANAADNPFATTALSSGYMVAETDKPLEGKCGAAMMKSGDKPWCNVKSMDTDGDGKVSPDEFNKFHGDMFGKMDANKDGFLDDSEVGKMREGKCGGEGKCGAMK